MSLPETCPNCREALKDTAVAHCRDQRRTPCGWVTCSPAKCNTTIDARGHHYPRKKPEETPA